MAVGLVLGRARGAAVAPREVSASRRGGGSATIRVAVRPNGGGEPPGWAPIVELSSRGGADREQRAALLRAAKKDEASGFRLFSREGDPIVDPWREARDEVFVVGPAERFVYPVTSAADSSRVASAAASNATPAIAVARARGPVDGAPLRLEQLAASPRLFRVRGFLSEAECAAIVAACAASPRLRAAAVTPGVRAARVSDAMFFGSAFGARTDPFLDAAAAGPGGVDLRAIEDRAAALVALPIELKEPTQLVRYREPPLRERAAAGGRAQTPAAGYAHHFDFVAPSQRYSSRSNRLLTLLVFLDNATVDDGAPGGGETHFPLADNAKADASEARPEYWLSPDARGRRATLVQHESARPEHGVARARRALAARGLRAPAGRDEARDELLVPQRAPRAARAPGSVARGVREARRRGGARPQRRESRLSKRAFSHSHAASSHTSWR